MDIVGQLGNLLLVDSDTNENLTLKASNQKKEILAEKNYTLPAEFLSENALSHDLIKSRTKNLSTIAYEKVWKVS